MSNIREQNILSEQYLCVAKKAFFRGDRAFSCDEKMLICHFTDLHSDWERLDKVYELINIYKPDFAIHTGDVVKQNLDDNLEYFTNMVENSEIPIYNCIGNHDTSDNKGKKSSEELNELIVKPLKEVKDAKDGHYYVDFDKFKVRLIVLNDYDFETQEDIRGTYAVLQPQCDWLIEILKDSAENDYSVIIASHECTEPIHESQPNKFCQRFDTHPWNGRDAKFPNVIGDIVDAFKHGKKIKKSYTYPHSEVSVNVDAEFSKGGTFICYLNGHRHGDFTGYLRSYPDQLSICMASSGCQPANHHNIADESSDLPRIAGTVSEDAVNFYTIDFYEKEICAVRFGAIINDQGNMRIFERFKY